MPSTAKESKKIAKVRNKLKKVMAEEKRCYTQEALTEMTQTIKKWISRHEDERISIKDKTFRLFNENENPAETESQYVRNLLRTLSHDEELRKGDYELRGRIQKH